MVYYSGSRSEEAFKVRVSAAPWLKDAWFPASFVIGGAARMYAIIATGGKQYRVSQGDVIYVEKLNNQMGDEVTFPVLMLGGDTVKVGNPTVAGAAVTGKVLQQGKGQKIVVFKYKSKKNYRRKAGHRQPFTKVEITAING